MFALRSPTIRLLVRENSRVGRLIYAAKIGPLALDRLSARFPRTTSYLNAFRALPAQRHLSTSISAAPPSLVAFLSRIRRALNKLRYLEEGSVATSLESKNASARINRVLLGGSSKILCSPLQISSPPLALTDPDSPSHLLTGPAEIKNASTLPSPTLLTFTDIPMRHPRPNRGSPLRPFFPYRNVLKLNLFGPNPSRLQRSVLCSVKAIC